MALKQFKLNILILILLLDEIAFRWDCWIKRNNCCFTDSILMHKNQFALNLVLWQILFSSTFWYQCKWFWPWIKVMGVWENNFWAKYFTKSLMSLDEMWHSFETCWSDESHGHFISSDWYSRERSIFTRFCQRTLTLANIWSFTDQVLSNLVLWWRRLNSTFWF